MDTEEHSDFKSIFAKFQDANCSSTLPASFSRNVPQLPSAAVSNVRSNPAFLGVISALESKPVLPPNVSNKPELPAKPNGNAHAVKPLFSPKEHSEDSSVVLLRHNASGKPQVLPSEPPKFKPPLPPKDRVPSSTEPMKLSRGLKKTLHIHIADSSRSDGDGVCTRSPQVYRQSYPTFPEVSNIQVGVNDQLEGQECYKAVSDAPPTPEKTFTVIQKTQMPYFFKKRPLSVSETNNTEGQECYETVSDAPSIPEKHLLPLGANQKSQNPSYPKKRPLSVSETNNTKGQACYETVSDAPMIPEKPLFPLGANQKSPNPSFLKKMPPPVSETNNSEDQNCYEPERPPTIPPRMSPATLQQKKFLKEVEANQSVGPECYEAVDDVPQIIQKPIVHQKPPKFSFLKKNPSPVPDKDQDFYETVRDAPPKPEKSPRPSIPPKKKYPPVTEANQSEGQECYEGFLQTNASKTFQESPKKHPLVMELDQSESQDCYEAPEDVTQTYSDQECYEDVDSPPQSPVAPPPSFRDYPNFGASTFPERDQCDGEECYEDVQEEVHHPPPLIDHRASQHNSPSFKINNKSIRTTEGKSPPPSPEHGFMKDTPPKPTVPIMKPKRNIRKMPKTKILPSVESLGPPPPKDLRPPHVDLTPYLPAHPPITEVQDDQEEMSESGYDVEYELPPPSPGYDEEESFYADAGQLIQQEEGGCSEYEVQEPVSEPSEANQLAESHPSPEPDEEPECYEDILKLRGSFGEVVEYEVQEAGSFPGPAHAGDCLYEVSEGGCDPGAPSQMNGGSPSAAPCVYEVQCRDQETAWRAAPERTGDPNKDAKITKANQAFRKKFKISGQEAVMCSTTITEDYEPERDTLPLRKGDNVDVIRITDCPPGRMLVKDRRDNYGFVPVSCVDVNKSILTFSNQRLDAGVNDTYCDAMGRNYDSGLGTDLSLTPDSNSVRSDDTYDDVGNRSPALSSPGGKSKGFGHFFKRDKQRKDDLWATPGPNSPASSPGYHSGDQNSDSTSDSGAREKESTGWKMPFLKNKEQKVKAEKSDGKGNPPVSNKKLAKEEKVFREKFKYTGDINVLSVATVTDMAPLTTKNKLHLLVKPGETVDVIDVTSEDQIICRNSEGKFGYVRIECLNFQNSY